MQNVQTVADIVSAYVSNNNIRASDLPDLIASVDAALKGLLAPVEAEAAPDLVPAVSIKKSITPDYLICLDDGKRFTSLRRHLGILGMTSEQYRAKWSLPSDYPMVAPAYSVKRSELGRASGLGVKVEGKAPKRVKEPKEPSKRGMPRKEAVAEAV